MTHADPAPAAASLLDPRAQAVVERLHRMARQQFGALLRHYLPKAPQLLLGQRIDWNRNLDFYRDKLLSIEPAQGALLYLLARSIKPRCVVEFGTSFGVSTTYLAAAVRDGGSGGRVVGTELVPEKIVAARANLAAAGLADHVEIREGDARVTLRDLAEPVDLLLLDGWPALGIEVLRIVEPQLADGAVVVVDNVGQFAADLRPVVERLASPPYRSALIPLRGGTLAAIYSKPCLQACGG